MKPVTTDDVFDLMDAYLASAALNAAMELGLFWMLAEQPLDVAEVAQALGIPENRCRHWLQLLCSTGLVEQVPEGCTPSATARRTILEVYSRETWAFLAEEARMRFPLILDLAQHIREPGSVLAALGLTPPDYFAQMVEDPERARAFTRMLYEIHVPYADALAATLDMSGVERLMDLGGGSGVVSLALLRRYPHLSATVVDIPSVCAEGREIAAENGLEGRITYHAADYEQEALLTGFDVVLLCDAGPHSEAFFRKIRAALNPGGRLVIVDQFGTAEGIAPASWLYWAFQAALEDPDYTPRTSAEVQDRLRQAGYQVLSECSLPVSEVVRWSSDWIVLEARR
jgi:cyclopropane fatty-acyl-phospholipid synthase-like methyltransferase